MNYVCITSDFDWAPKEVVEYFLNILRKYSVPATLFLTNKLDLNFEGHEIAIHPNYTSNDYDIHISELLNIYPSAKGVRSHSLFFTERLRPVYEKFGIEYQSNYMLYYQKNIDPFLISRKTIEIPLCWMDMFNMEMRGVIDSEIKEEYLESPGLKVFDFHPIHVFLNTSTISHYDIAKKHYQFPEKLEEFRNTSIPGTKDLLESLLEKVSKNKKPFKLLSNINSEFRNKSK